MYELIYSQENMLIISIALGVLMGASYDILRGIRRVLRHNNFWIGVQDALYWFVWAMILIYVLQNYNYGIIRLYIFLAIFTGLIIYLCTISRLYLFILQQIIQFTKKILKKVNNMLKCVVKKGKIIVTVKMYRKTSGDR